MCVQALSLGHPIGYLIPNQIGKRDHGHGQDI
jgi:hypothetical protein